MWLRVVSRLLLTTAWALLLSIVTSASAHAAGDLELMKELSGGDCDSLVHWETKPCEEFLTAFCQYLGMRFPGASVQDSFREFCSANHIDSIRYGTSQISIDNLQVKGD